MQQPPRQTKPNKGPKRNVHELHPFFVNSGAGPGETSAIHIGAVQIWSSEKFMNPPFFGLVCRNDS